MNLPAHFCTACRLDSLRQGRGTPRHHRGAGLGFALVRIKRAIGSRCAPGRGAAQAGRLKRNETVDKAKSKPSTPN